MKTQEGAPRREAEGPNSPQRTTQEASTPRAFAHHPTPRATTARDFLLGFAGMTAFLLVIAAAGLAAELVSGIGGLALYGGVFLVALCVLAREEGLL